MSSTLGQLDSVAEHDDPGVEEEEAGEGAAAPAAAQAKEEDISYAVVPCEPPVARIENTMGGCLYSKRSNSTRSLETHAGILYQIVPLSV